MPFHLLMSKSINLNLKNEVVIQGERPVSNFVVNEVNGVSFLYGKQAEEGQENQFLTTQPKLYKLDDTCELPEKVIEN